MPALDTLMELTTPLGDKVLNFSSMTGVEEMGRLFEYDMVVVGEKETHDPKALLGKPASVKLELSDKSFRYFHGIVTRFGLEGTQGKLYAYRLRLHPWLWLATRRTDTRIFQQLSVPNILKQVFAPHSSDFVLELSGSYAERDYCVQYRESDFNFVSRLMEEEGIYYFFRHSAGQHIMVLTDKATSHAPFPGHAEFRYRPQALGQVEYEAVTEWGFAEQIEPGKVTLDDYDFTRPAIDLKADFIKDRGHPRATYEVYNPPGDYLDKPDGERYAKLRVEERHARYAQVAGFGTMSGLVTGYRFKLIEHPRKDQNREHIVVSSRIEMRHPGYEAGNDEPAFYVCRFTALDSREVFRSERLTVKPVVPGPQTALVVGPAGDEIHTDTHGRIKVQFHWDREGKKDANSSCWLRVATPWAGKGWGMISLPRIGHEVVVEFLEGNPDRPLVTGSVYNGNNVTPYPLPAKATISTMKSRSSKGGGASNFNELRFEDLKGSEYVWFQAEKNHYHLVKADVVESIGNDRMTTIKNDSNEKIGGNQDIHVVGDVKHKIDGTLNHKVALDLFEDVTGSINSKAGSDIKTESSQSISVKAGQQIVTKAGQNIATEAGMKMSLKAGMSIVIEAGMSLTLKAGASSVVIGPAGVSIIGAPMVMINSGGGADAATPASPAAPTSPQEPKDPTALKDPENSR